MTEFTKSVANAVVQALKNENIIGTQNASKLGINEKSAYAKTEALLYNYNNFVRIIRDKEHEIEDLYMHGVPQKCGAVGERVQSSPVQTGIVLPEESVEAAVRNIRESMTGTLNAINLINKGMATLKNDPYYCILEMRYFEGRTQEDIAVELKCDQATISRNRSRLVKELSMRLFPNQYVDEIING